MLRRLILLALVAIVCLGAWQWLAWPDVAALAHKSPKSSAFIEAHRRESGDSPARVWVPYSEISDSLKQAVLVAEDIGFFSHQGFAVEEMKIAVRETVERGRPLRGASTITQQLAKNLWLSPSRNPLRKVKEVLLTRELERHLSKRRILELYLNFAQFGPDIFGAEAAARSYYATAAGLLNDQQAAELVAGLSRPRSWNPHSDSKGYRHRVAIVRARMRSARWILREL